MPEKLGIEEVKSAVALGLSLGELTEALGDGVGLGDIGVLLRAAKRVAPAIAAFRSGLILPELKDLSDVEKEQLKQFIVGQFDLENDQLEVSIEKGLAIAVDLCELLKVFP